jgi:fructose-6-phosphate aldolase, TalC/MipB family
MKLFLESASLEQIRAANALCAIEGVTTDPSLLAQEKGDWKKLARQICREVEGPVSLEVFAADAEGMLAEARDLVKIAPNVVIKIPVTIEGIKAIKELHQRGLETNATLVFSPNQALLAAKAGATYVSPFIGRLDDIGQDGLQVLQDIMTIFRNYEMQTQVLAASVRHTGHVYQAAMLGADAVTMPLAVLTDLAKHPLTEIGLEKYQSDWAHK